LNDEEMMICIMVICTLSLVFLSGN